MNHQFYKPSQFNLVLEQSNDKTLLSNIRTGKHITISQQEYKKLFHADKLVETDILSKYITDKFFVHYELDEANEYIEEVYQKRTDKNVDHLQLTIAPTMACNYRCQYCYEVRGNTICNSYMTDESIDDLMDFIKHQLEIFTKVKYIYIRWFGGEPLMRVDIMEKIIYKLRDEILIPRQIGLYQHIFTNGRFMTPDIADRLSQLHLDRAVISIEGLAPTYAYLKQCKEEDFYKVIENIKYAQDKFKIYLRTTVIDTNKDEIIPLVQYLDSQEIKCEYSLIRMEPNDNGIIDMVADISTFLDVVNICNKYVEENCKNITMYKTNTNFISYGCDACWQGIYTINPDGDIYKCHRVIGKKQYRVGNIASSKYDTNLADTWIKSKVQQKCLSCALLPICMNRCVTNEDINNIMKSCDEKLSACKAIRLRRIKNEMNY